jgi:hypothetical protein
MCCASYGNAPNPQLFIDSNVGLYDQDEEPAFKLKAIYMSQHPLRWVIWINSARICSAHPKKVNGWIIESVTKNTVILCKGSKKKTVYIDAKKKKPSKNKNDARPSNKNA